jgi:hypothetical protein
MRTIFIEVLHVLVHKATHLLLTENEHVIETFTAQAADESFAVRIGTGCAHRGAQNVNLCGCFREVVAEPPIIITDHLKGVLTKGCGFAELLHHPGIGG